MPGGGPEASRVMAEQQWNTLEQDCIQTVQTWLCRALPLFSLALDTVLRQESRHCHQDWGDAPRLYIQAQPSHMEKGNTKSLRVAVKIQCKDGLDVTGLVYNPSTGVLGQRDCEFEASLCHKEFWARLDSIERICWNKTKQGETEDMKTAQHWHMTSAQQTVAMFWRYQLQGWFISLKFVFLVIGCLWQLVLGT